MLLLGFMELLMLRSSTLLAHIICVSEGFYCRRPSVRLFSLPFLDLVVLQHFFQEYFGIRAAGPSVSSVVLIHASLHDVVIGVYGAFNAT